MLTVNYITQQYGHYTIERVFQVAEILHQTYDGEEIVIEEGEPVAFHGIKITFPDGTDERFYHKNVTHKGFTEKFYVMNDQGKTIATYSL